MYLGIEPNEGFRICPVCHGLVRYRWRWSEPSATNKPYQSDFRNCYNCEGSGVVKIENVCADVDCNDCEYEGDLEKCSQRILKMAEACHSEE